MLEALLTAHWGRVTTDMANISDIWFWNPCCPLCLKIQWKCECAPNQIPNLLVETHASLAFSQQFSGQYLRLWKHWKPSAKTKEQQWAKMNTFPMERTSYGLLILSHQDKVIFLDWCIMQCWNIPRIYSRIIRITLISIQHLRTIYVFKYVKRFPKVFCCVPEMQVVKCLKSYSQQVCVQHTFKGHLLADNVHM